MGLKKIYPEVEDDMVRRNDPYKVHSLANLFREVDIVLHFGRCDVNDKPDALVIILHEPVGGADGPSRYRYVMHEVESLNGGIVPFDPYYPDNQQCRVSNIHYLLEKLPTVFNPVQAPWRFSIQ